jgi:hypothetical protein
MIIKRQEKKTLFFHIQTTKESFDDGKLKVFTCMSANMASYSIKDEDLATRLGIGIKDLTKAVHQLVRDQLVST